jgi:transcriptional regulator with XRE-family HTH domain
MAVGESPAVARYRLRLALRQAREAKGLTQSQVARSLEWSLSKVNRIEAGEVTVSSTDLQALLRLFDITDPQRVEELMATARTSRRRGWWDQTAYREHLTPAMIQSIQFEIEASEIRSFQPTLIPGPLQTPAYATTIMDLWSGDLSPVDRATRVEARTRRRDQILHRADPPTYLLILDESVLLREVGGPRVMLTQLYDLLALIRTDRVTLRVVPLADAAAYAMYGMFVIYTSGGEDAMLYRESELTDEAVYAADKIRRHRRMFEQIWEHSLTEEASVHLVEARAVTMRSAVDRLRSSG